MANSRNILLAVTGLSPQVVTETLYAIYRDRLPWPDELHILTTARGKEQARLGLINDGMLQRLLDDYRLPPVKFSEAEIHVIPDEHGLPVDDARTLADQEALADFITGFVASLCADPATRVHASIAGGRKTMTFYLGYAMSLFGRSQDRLSHVLVSEPYEGLRDFYYPTPTSTVISGRGANERLDASLARVQLAEIPFIRHRQQLSDPALFRLTSRKSAPFSYRDLVRRQNLALQPEQLDLEFDLQGRRILLCGEPLSLEPLELAFYAMIARGRLDGENDLTRPARSDTALAKLYVDELEHIAGQAPIEGDLPMRLDRLYDQDIITAKVALPLKKGMSKSFFDSRRNALLDKLQWHLPCALVERIAPAMIYREDGSPLSYGESTKKGGYGLWLQPHQIKGLQPTPAGDDGVAA